MTENESQDKQAKVWPPAIFRPSPIRSGTAPSKAVRFGRISVTLAGVGIGSWVFIIALLWLLTALHKDTIGVEALITGVYFTGLACEASGLCMGLFGKATKIGRVGVVLSICLLIVMIVLTLLDFHSSGIWIWNQSDAGDCGCDGTG